MYVLVLYLVFLRAHRVGDGACGFRDVLDEVLLTPAGGLDGRRLLDGLGAAAGKEEDAAEHGAEDTDRKLWCAMCQLLCLIPSASCVPSLWVVQRRALVPNPPPPPPAHDRAERVCCPRG